MTYFFQVITRNNVQLVQAGTTITNDKLAVHAARNYMTNNEGVLSVQILSSVATVQRTTDFITVYDRSTEAPVQNQGN